MKCSSAERQVYALSIESLSNLPGKKKTLVFLGLLSSIAYIIIFYFASSATRTQHTGLNGHLKLHDSWTAISQRTHHSQDGSQTLSSDNSCFRQNDIAYLFNRKTGSTTLVNLLYRYSRKYQFPFRREVIIHKSESYGGYMKLYHVQASDNAEATADEGASGVAYGVSNHRWLLPFNMTLLEFKDDGIRTRPTTIGTKIVSIVRDPSRNFESAFNFFALERYVTLFTRRVQYQVPEEWNSLEVFMKNPGIFRALMRPGSLHWGLSRNSQLWQLGLDHRYHDNETLVEEYIDQLEKEIDFVFVTEYYDESLILLKRLMCWDMEDILYVSRRVRGLRTAMTSETRDRIYKWNYSDMKLYDRFNRTLWRKIKEYGSDFHKELKLFREIRDTVTQNCEQYQYIREKSLAVMMKANIMVENSVTYCQRLYSWFAFEVDTTIQTLDDVGYEVTPTRERFKGSIAARTSLETYTGPLCVEINYHRDDRWSLFRSDSLTLDVYLKTENTTISAKSITTEEPVVLSLPSK
ncbi:galactosylceramide sulfotransferase-like [Ptychodera flava]|uniref:galactosylceramide sulfotransferase-like n=1 Tax=Ptychodera flava TaxID=63121 RepID=UPI00396A72CD